MIGQGLGRLAFAEKLSIPQLEEALENKTIPAYIGVPLLEEKVQMRQRMQAAQAGMTPPPQMTIEEEIFARANQAGIDSLPVEIPEYANGGIVAFADGGDVQRFQNQGLVEESTPFSRSAIGRFAGSVGDYISEQEELAKLRSKLKRHYGTKASIFPGAFIEQPVGSMARAQQMTGNIYNLSLQELRDLAEQEGLSEKPSAPVAPPAAPPVAKQDPGIAPDVPQAPAAAPPQDVADPGIAPPETPAPRGASNLSIPELMGQTEQLYGALYGDQKPEAPAERGDYLTRAQEFLTQSGVDLDLASKQAQEVARQKAELEGDRREAKKFSVISAGLAILAGDPANSVAENIGKGLGKGMEQYTTAIKDLKKTEREMQALERSLAVAQNQARMGVATMAAGDYRDAQKRYDDLNKDMRTGKADLAKALMSDRRAREVVEAQMRSKPSTFSEQVEALMSDDPRRVAAAETAIGASKTGKLTRALLEKEWNDMKPQKQLEYKRRGITTVDQYVRSMMEGTVPDPSTGGSAGGATPPLPPGFQLQSPR